MKQYIVDAFTDHVFSGNPAAVCILKKWPSDQWMRNVAKENNLSETAFIVKEGENYHLRWFTPGTEVELCGHATLASAFVVLNFYEKNKDEVEFETLSGKLKVKKTGKIYQMDFPAFPYHEIPISQAMEEAFGLRPIKAYLGVDLLCIFEQPEAVIGLKPNLEALVKLEGRIQNASARGDRFDCLSRSFCPKLSIAEDPVCGSAHCLIASYWSQELGKEAIKAFQASSRGGTLYCKLLSNGRIRIGGEAVLFAMSEIVANEKDPLF